MNTYNTKFTADTLIHIVDKYKLNELQSQKYLDIYDDNELLLNNLVIATIKPIKIIDKNTFWVTSEAETFGSPYLYKISL